MKAEEKSFGTLDGEINIVVAVAVRVDRLTLVDAGVLAVGAADVQLGP